VKIACILNPNSGIGRNPLKEAEEIQRLLSERGHRVDLFTPANAAEAYERARAAVEGGAERVVAVGGDGTVHQVARALMGTEAALGIIPKGSGNGLARELGIPSAIDPACRILDEGQVRILDIGTFGDRFFFNIACIGFDALVGQMFNARGEDAPRGVLPYFFLSMRAFQQYRAQPTTFHVDGDTFVRTPLMIVVANSRQYGWGARIAPSAEPDDGLLDLTIIQNVDALRVLYHLPKLFTGQIERMPEAECRRAMDVVISGDRPLPVELDGEAVPSENVLRLGIIPARLRVCAPREGQVSGLLKFPLPKIPKEMEPFFRPLLPRQKLQSSAPRPELR
jgi:YegS/Rv2252/BmrU family lipid kinase